LERGKLPWLAPRFIDILKDLCFGFLPAALPSLATKLGRVFGVAQARAWEEAENKNL
jgi:hypothetical protein